MWLVETFKIVIKSARVFEEFTGNCPNTCPLFGTVILNILWRAFPTSAGICDSTNVQGLSLNNAPIFYLRSIYVRAVARYRVHQEFMVKTSPYRRRACEHVSHFITPHTRVQQYQPTGIGLPISFT